MSGLVTVTSDQHDLQHGLKKRSSLAIADANQADVRIGQNPVDWAQLSYAPESYS